MGLFHLHVFGMGFNKGRKAGEKQAVKASACPSSASCPSQVRAPGGHKLPDKW